MDEPAAPDGSMAWVTSNRPCPGFRSQLEVPHAQPWVANKPAVLRILPALTGWARVGLLAVMVLAAGEHALAGEFGAIVVNVVLGAMAAFVAWGRLGAVAIPAR